MKAILLSGGKGTRLWPISTDSLPKQFVSWFSNDSNMLKNTYILVNRILNKDDIYISTGKQYVDNINAMFSDKVNYIIEPQNIGTFGAIMNIGIYLQKVKGISEDETIAILPIDHDVDNDFYDILIKAQNLLEEENHNLCLIGIEPSFPSTQYGYILSSDNDVLEFCEKPSYDKAIQLIENNAVWNSGIVVCKLKKLIEIITRYFDCESYNSFLNSFSKLPHTSFDTEVLEKEKSIKIIKSNSTWSDLGTWEVMAEKISNTDEFNTNIINFENKQIRNEGVKNSILVNGNEGILLKQKKQKENIVYRRWGTYEVLNNFNNNIFNIKIKRILITPYKNISYQYHNYRNETWYVISGFGYAVIDDQLFTIKAGDVINVPKKHLHSIRSVDSLSIIEIQHGEKTIEEDIVRIEYNWDRILNKVKKGDYNE